MNEENVWHLLIVSVATVLISMVVACNLEYTSAFEHGYCQENKVGAAGTNWKKCADLK